MIWIYTTVLKELPGKPPSLVEDHRISKNNYIFRYGETWVESLRNFSSTSKLCCISDLVIFMVKEIYKIMKRSVHKDDILIVDDALRLIKSRSTITRKQKNMYLNWWSLPFHGLQYETTNNGCPVGNIPELIPLDIIIIVYWVAFFLKGKKMMSKKRDLFTPPRSKPRVESSTSRNCKKRIASFNTNDRRYWLIVWSVWNLLLHAWRGHWRSSRHE